MSVRVEHGDMREVLGRMVAEGVTVQSIVTDPPYGLSFMSRKWDAADNVAFQSGTWRLCFDLLPPGGHLLAFGGTRTFHRLVTAIEEAGFEVRNMLAWIFGSGFPKNKYALKPALEPICLARKPLVGTVAANVLQHGTGAINVGGCRIGATVETWPQSRSYAPGQMQPGHSGETQSTGDAPAGRWPANVCHDGSDEVVGAFPDGRSAGIYGNERNESHGMFGRRTGGTTFDDSGSAARFYYSAKADADDRLGSKHPTVKPVDLMRWLVRLITPPGGTVLDPFAGSGTTGMACMAEGFDCIMVEAEAEYVADIRRRVAHVHGDDTPLFSTPTEAA